MSKTPITDKAVRRWANGEDTQPTLIATCKRLEKRLQKAEAWKASALAVEAEWDSQKVGELLGLTIGTPIHAQIEDGIRKLIKENKKLTAKVEELEKCFL